MQHNKRLSAREERSATKGTTELANSSWSQQPLVEGEAPEPLIVGINVSLPNTVKNERSFSLAITWRESVYVEPVEPGLCRLAMQTMWNQWNQYDFATTVQLFSGSNWKRLFKPTGALTVSSQPSILSLYLWGRYLNRADKADLTVILHIIRCLLHLQPYCMIQNSVWQKSPFITQLVCQVPHFSAKRSINNKVTDIKGVSQITDQSRFNVPLLWPGYKEEIDCARSLVNW